ncbi:MAG: ATP-binding protein [Defluviitaleaceae bacterium]|nr:ATP-binding protein [Defluviitaleaceae bacterium]
MLKNIKQISKLIWTLIATFAVLAAASIVFLMLSNQAKNDIVSTHEIRASFDTTLHGFRSDAYVMMQYARNFVVMGCEESLSNYKAIFDSREIDAEARRVFDAYGATPEEVGLFYLVRYKHSQMQQIELYAINLRESSYHQAAMELLFSGVFNNIYNYTDLVFRFTQTMDELHSSISGRTQEMVTSAESRAAFFDNMSVLTTILFAAASVAGTFVLLRAAKNIAKREKDAKDLNHVLMDSLPMFLEFWNDKGELIGCSAKTLEIFGLDTKEDYINRFLEFQPKEQPCGTCSEEKTNAFVQTTLNTGQAQSEWAHIDKDEKQIIANTYFTRITVGGKFQVVGCSFDLTELKQAQATQQEIRAFNNMLIDSSPFIINLWNNKFELHRTNAQAEVIFEAKSQEDYVDNFFNFSPPYQPCGRSSEELGIANVKQAFETGFMQFEWIHQTANGEPIPSIITLVRLSWRDEYILVSYITDMREIVAANKKARSEEERAKILLEASPMACLMRDANLKMIDCNQAAIDMLARSTSNIYDKGRCTKDCRHCSKSGGSQCHVKEYLIENSHLIFNLHDKNLAILDERIKETTQKALTDGIFRYEEELISLDGDVVPCEITCVPIKYQDDISYAYYLRDLREEKRREAAEQESKTKTQFLARMSHEIRTPLNAIVGLTEIQLQKQEIDPDMEEVFDHIYASSTMLLSLINDILDLSRVEHGKMEIVPTMYEISNVITDVVQLNLNAIGSKNLELQLKISPNLPTYMYGDELRIKQVISNILSNALKYTPEGLVILCVDIEDEKDNNCTIVIKVKDTGIGMTKREVNEIFSEYSRHDKEETRNIQGAGLGMNIAHNLTTAMGGTIEVQSGVGVGSLFTVFLPQKIEGELKLGKELATSLGNMDFSQMPKNKVSKISIKPMPYGRVLAVDDVDTNLYVLEGLLALYNIKTESVNSGHKAIKKIEEGNVYDIIFMDHMMPEMDGVETTKHLRKIGYAHPIIALTANAVKGVREIFHQSGFDGFISKPINLSRLNNYLECYISEKQTQEILDASNAIAYQGENGILTQMSKLMEHFVSDAQRSIDVLEKALKSENLDDAKLMNYTIAAHSMVSALGIVGQPKLSKLASILEIAGKTKNLEQIKEQTPAFLLQLKEVIKSHAAKELEDEQGQDIDFLCEKLLIIERACDAWDLEKAEAAAESILAAKTSRKTKMAIKEIKSELLRGDFDSAAILAKQTAEILKQE